MRSAVILTLMWLTTGGKARACESIDRHVDPIELELRQPISGDEASRTVMFGQRREASRIKRQSGLDYHVPPETAVIAVLGGRIKKARTFETYGRTIIIDHGSRLKTLYAHLDGFAVREGDCVVEGTVLGRAGAAAAGSATLHFEASEDGQFIYPLQISKPE